jgi:peptide/nickel transport system substrate-binding protein
VSISLEANPHYYLGRPKIDSIEFFIIKDKNAAVARLLGGDLDYVEHMYIQAEHAAVLQDQWRVTGEGRILVTLWEPFMLGFQQKDVPNHQPALRDIRVREAVVRAIDRNELAYSEAAGLAPAADTMVVPTHPLYPRIDAAITKYPYDPRRATQLLSEAGWTRGGDGVLRSASGQPFTIGIISTINTQKGSVIVGDYFKQMGMEPSLYALSLTERTEGPRIRSTYPGVDISSPIDYRSYASFEMASEQNGWRGNPTGWWDPVFDDLFDRFDRSLVPSERDELQVQLELYVASVLGNAKLYYAARPIAMRSNLQGPKGMNYASTFTWNIHEWTLQ